MPKLTFPFEDIDDKACNIKMKETYYEETFDLKENDNSYTSELSLGDVSMAEPAFQYENIAGKACNIKIEEPLIFEETSELNLTFSRNESENDISHTSELSLGDISIPNNSQNNLKRKALPTLQSLKNKPIIINTINVKYRIFSYIFDYISKTIQPTELTFLCF